MSRYNNFIAFLLVGCSVGSVYAQPLAFPEAEGFGRFATGARTNLPAASVYHVTNLNDSGPGSFRDAVSQSNRFVVFDVGGIININSVVEVSSNVTIAGQTAPGGITLFNDRIVFHGANNLISRHFAVRKGNAGVRDDAASIVRGANMIFDHMSITWGVDGTFDINPDSGQVIDDITIQNSIIAQGLDRLGHSTGGLMQPGNGGSVSVVKSLYADNVTRNPKVRFENEFINNVVYGWETAAYIMGDTNNADSHANVEGNYFIEGPVNGSWPFSSGTSRFHIYADDNWVDTDRDGALDGTLVTNYPGANVVGTRHAFPTTATMTAQEAVAHVMENAGPHIIRDAVDTRLMEEVASYGTLGGVIERDTDLFPGYGSDPSYLNPRARLVDADNDGIADNWESAHGLNPANAADWKGLNPDGYTRLEEYVNELGAPGSIVTSTGGDLTAPSSWSGDVPTLADDAQATGNFTLASGHGFARRLRVDGTLDVTGGTLDVFDTVNLVGSLTINGGTVTAGQLRVASGAQQGSVDVQTGGTLQSGTVASVRGAATLSIDGGTFRATGAPDINLPTTLGTAGATFDTGGYSGEISGVISGSGGLTKRGQGELRLTAANTYTGPTVVEEGSLDINSSQAINHSPLIELHAGTEISIDGGGSYTAPNGQTIRGAGHIGGNLVAEAGSVLQPEAGEFIIDARAVGIQAEAMNLGNDWAIFDNSLHGTGNGGSYTGADLDGGGIVMVANEALSAPMASGIATTTVDIPEAGTWYLFAKVSEPVNSGVSGDPSTHPGGNNSFYPSGTAGSLEASPSSFTEVQTPDNQGDDSRWVKLSPSLAALDGVSSASPSGIDYSLAAGSQTFSIGGREIGTILDGFVLANSNLTSAELDAALGGTGIFGDSTGMAITGSYIQQPGSVFEIELNDSMPTTLFVGATADLGGELAVELVDGFTPDPSDTFAILSATELLNTFSNAPLGSRISTLDGMGSFVVDYDYQNNQVLLSDFLTGLSGDFDNDGDVDGGDFLLWQRGESPNPYSASDLADWQANYGTNPAAQQTAIPEPAPLVLFLLGATIMSFRGPPRNLRGPRKAC